jgi:hypothetical protein
LQFGPKAIQAPLKFVGKAAATAYERVNTAFGTHGDSMRLYWAKHLFDVERANGKTFKSMIDDGTLREIAEAANKLTGWSEETMASDIMNALFFAPRYLLARVGTYGDGLMGVTKYAAGAQPGEAWRLPGAAIRSTRKSEQEIHMKSLISFIGYIVYYTELINWLAGHETDRRPIVDGRYNTNFYNIRFGG